VGDDEEELDEETIL
jgi:hypothetical protein